MRNLARWTVGLSVCALLPLSGPDPANAQVGAFGGAPPAVAPADGASHFRAPIFSESAVLSPAGALGGTLLVGMTTGGVGTLEYEVTQSAAAVSYAVTDAVMVGGAVQPWNQVTLRQAGLEESESGRGNASVFVRARVWESEEARTTLAATGALGLPMGTNGFGTEGVVLDMGIAASRQLEAASLHSSVGLLLPTDDLDGESVVRLSGGAMFRAGDRVALGAELMAQFSDGEHAIDLAPGLRFQASDRLILDAGVLVNATTSLDHIYDGAVLLAIRVQN